ncbi:MAG: EndoU domain-containing protein [Xenococcaceae cyanobacterium]
MKNSIWMKLAVSLGIGLAIYLLGITPLSIDTALAQVGPRGTFTTTRTCEATQSIRRGQNPGNIQVSEGQSYEAVGFNSPDREFIYLRVPGARPERRWVNATCGTFSEATETPEIPTSPPAALLPFFDTVDNPVVPGFPGGQEIDMTPPPPELNNFDQAVLEVCGPFDSRVDESTFKTLMSDNPDVLREIQEFVDGEIVPGREREEEFLDDLTDIWFQREGFQHIFCGERSGSRIGGLHFVGRYLELQEEGIGGRLLNNLDREEVVSDVIYTLGVEINDGDLRLRSRLKGYALVSNAEEILANGTRAFKAFDVRSSSNQACIYTILDEDTNRSFQAVFVRNNSGIRTFYPDATPNGQPCNSAS